MGSQLTLKNSFSSGITSAPGQYLLDKKPTKTEYAFRRHANRITVVGWSHLSRLETQSEKPVVAEMALYTSSYGYRSLRPIVDEGRPSKSRDYQRLCGHGNLHSSGGRNSPTRRHRLFGGAQRRNRQGAQNLLQFLSSVLNCRTTTAPNPYSFASIDTCLAPSFPFPDVGIRRMILDLPDMAVQGPESVIVQATFVEDVKKYPGVVQGGEGGCRMGPGGPVPGISEGPPPIIENPPI
ncbi:hypothetical protein FA13DRAFT_1717356 [Coprinellus micaceus]|uniref:Uncharacterized protein n=1 Tax=Coprinellus micaceus TaxID=71717 RepID=A0A4Y7SIA7_COPMI|nr:hypothetical protein FA13DRAFT_1717356 [Coprinellus micaceus]